MENRLIERKTQNIVLNHENSFNIFLYKTFIGRLILKLLTRPFISKLVGFYLSSVLSKIHIKSFIKNNKIKIEEYENVNYKSFNEFFSRRIKPDCRIINSNENILISPCDAKLSVYKINDNLFKIKNSVYKITDLVNKKTSDKYQNGYALIFRLGVDDYHRYSYIDDGYQENNNYIKGLLHTVRPIAYYNQNIFIQNQREWTVLHTKHFGDVIQIEVGALLVGKIVNKHEYYDFKKGEEKGYFKFGGSTIILLIKDITIDKDLINNTDNGYETIVKLGEKIGIKQ